MPCNAILANNQLVTNSIKYSTINFVTFDQEHKKIMDYDELLKRVHVINCIGTNPDEPTVYRIYFPSFKVRLTRIFRQYYQLQTIPIGFLISRFVIRLTGNASLEYYVDNQKVVSFSNPFYQIKAVEPVPNNLRQEYNTFLFYTQNDEIELTESPYYLEPLLISNPHVSYNQCLNITCERPVNYSRNTCSYYPYKRQPQRSWCSRMSFY